MIKCLPVDVQRKLRSGVAIPSIQQCVEELILNSIDAGATCVGVRMDMDALKIQVIDNGAGMTMEDMECVGNRYHTSKCRSLEDLYNVASYGFRGEALASIAAMATLVEISSRTRTSVKTHTKLFKEGSAMGVFEAETSRPSAGTTVIVCNFFYNMPVRRKRLDSVLEGERVRHRLEAVSLMHPSVSFTLKNDSTGAMMVQLPKAKGTYHRFVQIHGLPRAEKLGEIHHKSNQFEITGHLGKEGHYNNSLQFLYVNERLLLKTRIHKLLNALLRKVSGPVVSSNSPDGSSVLRSPKQKRNSELFGVYILNLRCPYSSYDICFEPAKTLIEFKEWDNVLLCVEEAVKVFLKKENLVCEVSPEDLDSAPTKVQDFPRTDQGTNQASTTHRNIPSVDSSVGTLLASESVHRKCAKEDVCPQSGPTKSETNEPKDLEQEDTLVDELEIMPSVEEESEVDEQCEHLVSDKGNNSKLLIEDSTDPNSNTSYSEGFIQAAQSNLNATSLVVKLKPGQGSLNNKKISLSDPYIHNNLQTLETSKTTAPALELQDVSKSQETKVVSSKRKVSLELTQNKSCQDRLDDCVTIIPPKISRVISCQKPSALRGAGSLDRFRRMYVEPVEFRLPGLQEQRCRVDSRSKDSLQESGGLSLGLLRASKVTEMQIQNPLSPLEVEPPNKDRKKEKISLAAKLCHLKEHTVDDPQPVMHPPTNIEDNRSVSSSAYVHKADRVSQSLQASPQDKEPLPICSPHHSGDGEAPTSSDWFQHFDTSVGKTVFVNRTTGLSRYDDPGEETQVCCTSDVTNVAVSVISETGVEYRCYPFQTDVVLPFLPKPRSERVVSSGIDYREIGTGSPNSLSLLYSKWKNPVFVQPPEVGVNVTGGQADGFTVKIHNILFPYRFSKAMIHTMKVIQQVDKKFLACLINTKEEELKADCETEGNLLVLVDQHAAHERVRLENLIKDSFEDDPETSGEKVLSSSNILPPLQISVTEEELRLLSSCKSHLRSLGLQLSFSETPAPCVLVGKVPLCFMEKENNELRRGRPSIIKLVVEKYLREQMELLRSTGRVRGTLPLTVLKVLASLACHGAIKFNDSLSKDECHSLVASLSSCQLPFQCAHGRPSIAPLADVCHLDEDPQDFQKPNLLKLRRMYRAWQLYGKN